MIGNELSVLPLFCCVIVFVILVKQSLLLPANEVCEGNVFTGVCLSMGEVCIPACTGQWVCIPACAEGVVCPGGCLSKGCLPSGVSTRGVWQIPPTRTRGRHPRQILWDTVNKQAVRIPLECILVSDCFK